MNISTMKRSVFMLLALAVLASCAKEPLETGKAGGEKKQHRAWSGFSAIQ